MELLVRELAAPRNRLVPVLYITHALVELALGALKLRGSYAGLTTPDEAARFVRHHGLGLLALALLSGECARRGLTSTAAGGLCSLVLAFFHTGAVVVLTYEQHFEAVALHVPFAAAFAIHAAAMSVPPDKEH
jgi:hypothetical protein